MLQREKKEWSISEIWANFKRPDYIYEFAVTEGQKRKKTEKKF